MSPKIFDNDLRAIRESKVTLMLNNPVNYLRYGFRYDYIKNKYGNNSKLSLTSTESLIYETKTEDVCEDFSSDKEMFDSSNYSSKSKYYDDSSKLVIGKMKDETGGIMIEEFVRLKSKIYSFMVSDNNEHKKAKHVNRNVIATKSHNE